MSATPDNQSVTVALIGNPNTGKSTLFNALAGVRQRVGNYPGVTVEKKLGRVDIDGREFTLVDLPGTYSLAPRSPDEMIAVDVLLGRRDDVPSPDVVLCIVDASNLERNLYLVSQALELARPTVLALNMTDVAREKGIELDIERLCKQLAIPIAEIQANRKIGLDKLKTVMSAAVGTKAIAPKSPFPEAFQEEVKSLQEKERSEGEPVLPRYLIERLLLDSNGYLEESHLPGISDSIVEQTREARDRLAKAGCPVPAVEAMSRYKWVGEILDGVVTRPKQRPRTLSDKIDKILTHKLGGTIIFMIVMALMFQVVYRIADPASWAIDQLNGALSSLVENNVAEGAFRSLLVSGVIEGVGGVLVFLPQIFALFLCIAVLEDCGYMSRAAYLMDKLMSQIGLSGKSFIPLLSSFACAIPGIMAARVIENPRDRLLTILIAPLMSCSARLPVYIIMTTAFFPERHYCWGLIDLHGLVIFAMYGVGIIVGILVALLLKYTILRGETPPFVMELPSYKMPGAGVVLHRMFNSGWAFVRRAGTLIFAVSIIVWAAAYYPRNDEAIDPSLLKQRQTIEEKIVSAERTQLDTKSLDDQLAKINNHIDGEYLENSYLGRAGHFIEPAVKPLGWDWRVGCAAIASFPAREVVIASLGVIYGLGSEHDEESKDLRTTLQNATWRGTDRKVFNIPVALSVMVFFALCAQCVSTLAVMRRETGSWRWPIFTFVYMTTLAYVAALATYQIGMLFVPGSGV